MGLQSQARDPGRFYAVQLTFFEDSMPIDLPAAPAAIFAARFYRYRYRHVTRAGRDKRGDQATTPLIQPQVCRARLTPLIRRHTIALILGGSTHG